MSLLILVPKVDKGLVIEFDMVRILHSAYVYACTDVRVAQIIMGLIDLILWCVLVLRCMCARAQSSHGTHSIGFLGYGLSLYWRTSHTKEVHSAVEMQEVKKVRFYTARVVRCAHTRADIVRHHHLHGLLPPARADGGVAVLEHAGLQDTAPAERVRPIAPAV